MILLTCGYYTHAVPAPSVSVAIDSTSPVLFEGQQLTLVCYVSAVVDIPLSVTTTWSGPNGFTSVSIATQVPNTNMYEGINGNPNAIDLSGSADLRAGDLFEVITPGGGGHGAPSGRAAILRAADRRAGRSAAPA